MSEWIRIRVKDFYKDAIEYSGLGVHAVRWLVSA